MRPSERFGEQFDEQPGARRVTPGHGDGVGGGDRRETTGGVKPDAPDGEPGAGSPGWTRTALRGVLARTVVNLQRSALALIALIFGARSWGQNWERPELAVLVVIAGVVAINAIGAWVAWRHQRYCIGEDDIRVERGLISRWARAVPYERIQDVSLEEGPVPRLLGLVEVRFETGAGGRDEIRLAYVSKAQGEALREVVRARKLEGAEGVPSGAAIPAEGADGAMPHAIGARARVLFTMGPRRLLTFGVFEFSLVVFAVLFGLVAQFDFLLPFDITEPSEWGAALAGPGERLGDRLEEWGAVGRALGVALALALVALIGLVTGIVRTVLRDHGFVLEETPRGLRRRKNRYLPRFHRQPGRRSGQRGRYLRSRHRLLPLCKRRG